MDLIGQILSSTTRERADCETIASIDEWIMWLLFLREVFGGDAKLYSDAEYNNVQMIVEPGYHVFGRSH